MDESPSTQDRYRGALLGLAAGDAVGTTLEFKSPGAFEPITGMVGGGPFGLEPGQWTDDTSMALCLAESLVEQQGFEQVMEAAAYTWFNRFAAIRFMELHGYLDHSFRVLSPSPPVGED